MKKEFKETLGVLKKEFKIKKKKLVKNIEKLLVWFIWVILILRMIDFLKNLFFLLRLKPVMMEIEILPLILFFNVYHLNAITLVICAGILLLYYKNKQKGGKK